MHPMFHLIEHAPFSWEAICPSGNHHLSLLLDWFSTLLFPPTFTYISITDYHLLPPYVQSHEDLTHLNPGFWNDLLISNSWLYYIKEENNTVLTVVFLISWRTTSSRGGKNNSSTYQRGTYKTWVPVTSQVPVPRPASCVKWLINLYCSLSKTDLNCQENTPHPPTYTCTHTLHVLHTYDLKHCIEIHANNIITTIFSCKY